MPHRTAQLHFRAILGALAGLVFLASVAAVSLAPGAAAEVTCARYASPAGSDTAAGTATAPFRTSQKLVASLAAGQTGCLLGGTYTGNVTFSTASTGLATAPGSARATLSGGYVYIRPGASGVSLSGLAIDGYGSTQVTVQVFADSATLTDVDITNRHGGQSCVTVGEYEGSYATIVSGFTLDHARVHDCGQLANGNHDHGVYLAATRGARVTNSVFFGNQGGWGLQLWADAHGTTVDHNVFDANYAGDVIIAGGSYSSLGPSSNNTFTANILTWPSQGYGVTSYWEGAAGSNNVLDGNCVHGAPSGPFDRADGGFVERNSVLADPLFVNRTAHDYTLQPGSPCAGMGVGGSASAPPPPVTATPSFAVAVAPTSLSVPRWGTGSATVSLSSSGGFAGDVALSVSGLPSGASATLSPSTISTSGSAQLSISAGAARRGYYTVTVRAASGGVARTATFTLRVTRAA